MDSHRKQYSFGKSQRLCGQLRIKRLYAEGQRFIQFPLRVSYQIDSAKEGVEADVQVLLWAPKSLFRHAVDRNRIRRQMREAYRLSAQPLRDACREACCPMKIAVNYIAKQPLPYSHIQSAMRKAVSRLRSVLTPDS